MLGARLEIIARQAREIVTRPDGGHLLLSALSEEGWFVWERAAFAGDGLLIGAFHDLYGEVRERHAATAAEVAVDIIHEALALTRSGPLQ